MNRTLHLAALWLPVVVYGGMVFYLSSLPQAAVAGFIPDYLIHSLEYLGLTVLIIRALNEDLIRPIPATLHFAAVALAVLYAVSDEIHQLSVPRRTASFKDVLSDTLGAVLAVGVAEAIQRIRTGAGSPPIPVTLFTRGDCHLCCEARQILEIVSRETPLRVSEIDVDSDPELDRRFGSEVPVIVANGSKISKLVPDEKAIRRRLLRMASRPR